MRKNGIQAKRKKKFKATTNSKHNLPVAENLLNRDFSASKNQNFLRDEDIEKIAATYHAREEIARFSWRVSTAEVAENEFNLNVPRYIDTFVAPEEVDIAALQREVETLEEQLTVVRGKLSEHLRDLGLVP